MIDWKPIETAPKNPEDARSGPEVFLWDRYHGCAWLAYWTTGVYSGCIRTGWWVAAGRRKLLDEKHITHWAPLTPPQKEKSDE